MTPAEQLTKFATDVTKELVTDLGKKALGGPLDQLGGMLEDEFKVRRLTRFRKKILPRLQEELKYINSEPSQIPDAILIPAIEAATLTDDELLQAKWAALLANASNGGESNRVFPSFVEILKQLSTFEAKLLDQLVSKVNALRRPPRAKTSVVDPAAASEAAIGSKAELLEMYFSMIEVEPEITTNGFLTNEQRMRFDVALGNLLRNQLIAIRNIIDADTRTYYEQVVKGRVPSRPPKITTEETYVLTGFAFAFVSACTPGAPPR